KTGALLIRPRIKERDQTFQSPWHEDQQTRSNDQSGRSSHREMKHARAGGVNHNRKDQHEHHRGAEVRLDHVERREKAGHDAAWTKRAPEVAFFTRALLEEVRKKNYEGEF